MDEISWSAANLRSDDAFDLIEGAPCGLVITDQNGRITFCNERFATWTGRDRKTLSTLRIRDLLDTVGQIYYDTHILPMLMLQGYVREILCRLQPIEGQRMPVLLNAGSRPATNDRPAQFQFTVFDATERAMYEADLRRARDDAEELASIVRSAAVAILRVDRQGRISRWNDAAIKLFGLTVEQALGADLSQLVQLKGRPDWIAASIKAAEAAKSHHRFQDETVNEVHLDLTISKIANAPQNSDRDYFSVILRDVSERVINERRLKVVLQELNHRVKNTLAVVGSIARRTFSSPGVADEKLQFEARLRALARAHDILVNSSWDSGSLREIVEITARDSGYDSAFSVAGPDLQFPPSDVTMLSMALFELTTNAIKYGALSQPDGSVQLNWSLSDDEVPIFTLDWIEQGGPKVVPPTSPGFGSQMLERLVTAELGGTAELNYHIDGVHYRLTAPFKGSAQE